MTKRVLVTGGAGFIGSHVVEELVTRGHEVIVLDSLEPQVHGPDRDRRPPYLRKDVELVVGDVRDREVVGRCLEGVDAVVHLAAAVGLAQSMYEMERFVDANARGTAVLLEAVAARAAKVRRVVVASSMSLYGEGSAACPEHGTFAPGLRSEAQLADRDFEVRCPRCRATAAPVATPESAPLVPTTVYAVTKRDQEELVLAVGAAYGIPSLALRLFNVYGPNQALSNPYTGVAAIFSSRLLSGNAPLVFEDGHQTRDFTHVRDVAEAFARAVDAAPEVTGVPLNVGAGRPFSLLALGELLAAEIGVAWKPEVTRSFRKGDIRHCTADTTALEKALGFRPRVDFRDGVRDLVGWVRTQEATDMVDKAHAELKARGLVS